MRQFDLNAEAPIHFCIKGVCVSLKNSRDIALNRRTGRLFPKRNAAIERFSADFAAQLPLEYRSLGLSGPVCVTVDVFYPTRRQDLDVAIIYDLLQANGVILNDRQIVEAHCYKHLDRDNPRVSVIVREIAD